jgi:hypothetical protein
MTGKHTMKSRSLVLLPLLLLTGCEDSKSLPSDPKASNPDAIESWAQVDGRAFAFRVPPDMKAVPVQGIDSEVGEYRGDSISLSFDHGLFSDPMDYRKQADYISHEERINGRKARIVSYYSPGREHPFDFAIGVHFPNVNGKNVRLTVYARCKTKDDYETARTIFRTIRFK